MQTTFINYINNHEDWLMERILDYALQRDYTQYTSTLKEAWRLSISGLSKSLIELIQVKGDDIELGPDEDYTSDPATQFGIIEAKRHRERGTRLDMFLGLMKYYRQSYLDLINESSFNLAEKQLYSNLINRFFDRVEIAFCKTWAAPAQEELLGELQERNRLMTNEKNKYLTIFESLSMSVFIVDPDGKIENMSFAAANMITPDSAPGAKYYQGSKEELVFGELFPWLVQSYNDFIAGKEEKLICEKYLDGKEQYFQISFSRSLDISGKLSGTIVIIKDISQQKQVEKKLERLATTDPLTGAKNRRIFLQLFEKELARSQRYKHTFAVLMIDIDNFKDINDRYGHDIGDKVLKLLVSESQDIIRGSDLFCRWGGEEFMVLLPESDIQQAVKIAERLRGNLSEIEIATDNGEFIRFTVSIGMTIVEDKKQSLDDIVKKTDKALYLAKEEGRNRVVSQ
jgi:diguanylate cyclase (GGDEF)-like protein